jgi:cytosine/adenosine deaminase-related metal-dependent hydrolase
MAWENNARLAAIFYPNITLGRIAFGSAADLMVVDYYPYTPLTTGNLPWHVIFGFESSMVRTTIVAGRILMKDRQLLTLNEKAIAEEARAIAPALWARYYQYAEKEVES